MSGTAKRTFLVLLVTVLAVLAPGFIGAGTDRNQIARKDAVPSADPDAPALGVGPAHWYRPGAYGSWGNVPSRRSPVPFAVDNLANPGNGEIMPTTYTHVIFWLPAGFHYSGGTTATTDTAYENTVLKYFQDVGGSQILNTATQYSGNNGSPADTSTFVDSIVDTTAFPHTGADVAHALTQTDINIEVFNQIGAHSGWNFGLSDMYFVFLPNNLVDCNDALTSCNTNSYCAYHTYGFSGSDTPAHDFVWADIPDNRSIYAAGGCGDSNVTGNESADTTLSSVEHEHLEAITDPRLNAWLDSTGGENGDKCNREMGVADSSSATANNYLGAGAADLFRIQREWSNAVSGCAASYTTTGSHVVSPTPSGGDVTLSVTEATIPGNIGDQLHYSMTFTNPSDQDDAYGIVATATKPGGLSGTTVFNLGNLAPHQTASRSFTWTVSSPLAAGATLPNSTTFDFQDSTGAALPGIVRTATTSVVNTPPTLVLPGDQTQDFNDVLTFGLSATDPDAGDTILLSATGLPSGLGLVDHGDRTATVSGTITALPGPYLVTFTADDQHHVPAVTATLTINVTNEESALAYTGASTGDYHDPAVVSAVLTDPDGGAPIAGKTVSFSLGAPDACSATTDGTGVATCTIVPTHTPGTLPLAVSFAGDVYYLPSATVASFVITKEESALLYTGPGVVFLGQPATLSARLLEDGSAGISGRTVRFELGTQVCTGTSGPDGLATCQIVISGSLGTRALQLTFAGDSFYVPASLFGGVVVSHH